MSEYKTPNAVIDRRYDFVYLFDVQDGNPNGDPDAGNLPRLDPQTLQGFTTDGCIKRKIRNAVEVIKGADALAPDKDIPLDSGRRYEIYFKHQGVLNEINRRAFVALGIDAVEGSAEEETEPDESQENAKQEKKPKRSKKQVKDPETAPRRMEKARQWMCRNFYDVRTFGAVMSTGVNAGQVRGPVQITYARSIDPIVPTEAAITRKSVNKQEDADKQVAKHGFITGTFGRRNTVSYALYRGNGFINPFLAMGEKGTGLTFGDLRLFFDAMLRMFDFNASSSQGTLAMRSVHVFEHASALGNARAFELIERVRIKPIAEDENPERRAKAPRSFDDYRGRITIDLADLPTGVAHYELPRDFGKLFPNGSA